MARIAGIDLPKNKRGEVGLTYIFGIGRSTARYILDKANVDYDKKESKRKKYDKKNTENSNKILKLKG